jgi:hypothetical protein
MKNSFCALGCAVICGLSLSSCMVDSYGVPLAGGFSSGPSYESTGHYDSGFCASAPVFSPSVSSFGIFDGGFGNGCNTSSGYGRPSYSSHHHSDSHNCPMSPSYSYASQVVRPSTFRGRNIMSSPPSIPHLPAPRTLSRPTFPSAPVFSSRSSEAPSISRPSGGGDFHSRPGVVSAPHSFSGGAASFTAALPSNRRRER